MALVGAGVRLSSSNPMRQFGNASAGVVCKCTWSNSGAIRSAINNSSTTKAGIPNGARHPTAWAWPTKSGGLSSYQGLVGDGDVSFANLAGGLPAGASLTGSGALAASGVLLVYALASVSGSGSLAASILGKIEASADLTGEGELEGLLVSLAAIYADLAGDGTISSASLVSVALAIAALTGAGSLDATGTLLAQLVADLDGDGDIVAGITGALEAASDLAGVGNLTGAATALGWVVAALSGAGSLAAQPYATGDISADLRAFGDLTPEGLSAAVWGALAAANNSPGTMGELLNASGAGGNPWVAQLEGTYTAADLLRIIASALAGTATVPNGAGSFAFRDLYDTKDRITGTVDNTGAREVIDVDGT